MTSTFQSNDSALQPSNDSTHDANARSGIQVAVAGEALIDLIRRDDGAYLPCLGGALYNLSRALSRQGVGIQYLNPLSRDRFGRELREQLVADGVQLAVPEAVQQVTSLAVVNLDAQGHPDYAFYRDGVADRAVSAQGLTAACAALPALEIVCSGALALDARDTSIYLPWLEAQRQAGRCVVVDANLRPSVMPDLPSYRAAVHAALSLAHVIKVSDEDLQHLGVRGTDVLDQARGLMAQHPGCELLALTVGAGGAWLMQRSGATCYAKEAAPLAVVDTVGAGDSFLAGLLAFLLRHSSLPQQLQPLHQSRRPAHGRFVEDLRALSPTVCHQALRHALASASLCVQEQGCVPPSWDAASRWAVERPALG